jgi:sulfite reductase (ferredoxin)
MTGCPNGCTRPYSAEIGIVGRTAGIYDIYAGGDFNGTRLAQVLEERVPYKRLVPTLVPILESYRHERLAGERFGDYCARAGNVRRFELFAVSAPA